MLIQPGPAVMAFLATYFAVYWLLVLLERGVHDRVPRQLTFWPSVTIAIPAYNEEDHVLRSVESVCVLDYLKKKLEILVVDDGSSDRTREIVRKYITQHPDGPRVVLLEQKTNQGKGAALNRALREACGEIFICLDADSAVRNDALHILMPHFAQPEHAAVLPVMKPLYTKNLIQKLQRVEYMVNHLLKKIVGTYDCIPVTPGPFSCYRTAVLKELGGFDEHNLTEDLEIALRLQKHHYQIVQVSGTEVYTDCPATLRALYRQRNRWYTGTMLNLYKHRDMLLNKEYGEFGVFYLPFGIVGALISIGFLYFITWDQMIYPLINKLHMLSYIHFDMALLFRNWTHSFQWIDLDFLSIFLMSVFILFALFWIFLAHRVEDERYTKDSVPATFVYLGLYPLFLSLSWIGVVVSLLHKKRRKW